MNKTQSQIVSVQVTKKEKSEFKEACAGNDTSISDEIRQFVRIRTEELRGMIKKDDQSNSYQNAEMFLEKIFKIRMQNRGDRSEGDKPLKSGSSKKLKTRISYQIPTDEYEAFKELCEVLGLKVSKEIRRFVRDRIVELRGRKLVKAWDFVISSLGDERVVGHKEEAQELKGKLQEIRGEYEELMMAS